VTAAGQPRVPERLSALLPSVIIACTACQNAWEPEPADWETGNTGCPDCGGWTFIASLAEPESAR
jgi:hypothetical protein